MAKETKAKTKKTTNATLTAGSYLRVTDLAQCLGISKNTIWRLVREGKFPEKIKLGPRMTVWSGADVLKWLESKKEAA
jgi:prophage regulatory protein